ncbi:MAG: 3-dehydroquinate synthase [Aeropyrum sp.]|nr:3-dehydroquinate synthase [Aeropyrum sp.]MCE4616840.1 3-dehydroquinate synthase [Aeropyrum sp.]
MAQASLDRIPTVVEAGWGALARLGEIAGRVGPDSYMIAADMNVPRDIVEAVLRQLPNARGPYYGRGEESKSLEWVLGLLDEMISAGLTRSSLLLAVGGGAILDAAGFAASIYMRGVRLGYVPTTSLSMFDAAVGGKTAINYLGRKNVLGTFYHPHFVVADASILARLPRERLVEGIAELVKHAVISGWSGLDMVEGVLPGVLDLEPEPLVEAVKWSLEFKLSIVSKDFRDEKGIRAVLNLGHTAGHAIEACSGFKVSHGRAVSVGLVWELEASSIIVGTPRDLKTLVSRLLGEAGLPISLEDLGLTPGEVIPCIASDKKRRGRTMLFPIVEDAGRVEVRVFDIAELSQLLIKASGGL